MANRRSEAGRSQQASSHGPVGDGSSFSYRQRSSKPSISGYLAALGDRRLLPTGIRVALVVGTIYFAINHGPALVRGEMTRDRWISVFLTYLVPYCVNVYGQYVSHLRLRER